MRNHHRIQAKERVPITQWVLLPNQMQLPRWKLIVSIVSTQSALISVLQSLIGSQATTRHPLSHHSLCRRNQRNRRRDSAINGNCLCVVQLGSQSTADHHHPRIHKHVLHFDHFRTNLNWPTNGRGGGGIPVEQEMSAIE